MVSSVSLLTLKLQHNKSVMRREKRYVYPQWSLIFFFTSHGCCRCTTAPCTIQLTHRSTDTWPVWIVWDPLTSCFHHSSNPLWSFKILSLTVEGIGHITSSPPHRGPPPDLGKHPSQEHIRPQEGRRVRVAGWRSTNHKLTARWRALLLSRQDISLFLSLTSDSKTLFNKVL